MGLSYKIKQKKREKKMMKYASCRHLKGVKLNVKKKMKIARSCMKYVLPSRAPYCVFHAAILVVDIEDGKCTKLSQEKKKKTTVTSNIKNVGTLVLLTTPHIAYFLRSCCVLIILDFWGTKHFKKKKCPTVPTLLRYLVFRRGVDIDRLLTTSLTDFP